MHLVESFVRNPVKVSVGVLLVALFGAIALVQMPMQLTPEVETPTITVTTRWPGASPQEIEQEIIIEQEEQLKGVEGSTKLSSQSSDSQGEITIEFAVGTDMDQALLRVNSRLSQVPDYPVDANLPVLTTTSSGNSPIAWFIFMAMPPDSDAIRALAVHHPEHRAELERIADTENLGLRSLRLRKLVPLLPEAAELLPPPEMDVTKLRRFAEDEIQARFERVSGVAQSNVIGGLDDEMQVIVDPERLSARQITMAQVRDVLQAQNKDTSAGEFWEGKRRWVVRALGEFRTPEQVEAQLLAVHDGAPVFVRDVATVQHGYKKPDGLVRRYGEASIAINCIRETGANVLDVMEGLRQVTAEVNRDVLNPRGLLLSQAYDETEYIDSSVNLVRQNIFIGGALTMIVLMLFLHLRVLTLLAIPLVVVTALASVYFSPWWFIICLAIVIGAGFWFARGALVVGLAIPTSIIGTFLVLGWLGRSLNVISLAGMAFAVGMLVDNAVVVLENIYRRYSMGESPLQAAVKGTEEVWGAVVSSTLTTIAVFLPVLFVQEQAGQLFRDIALAISAAVGLSLVVSVTMIPTFSARLFRGAKPSELVGTTNMDGKHLVGAVKAGRLIHWVTACGRLFTGLLVGLNAWIQRSIVRQVATILLLVASAVGVTWALWPQVEYLPGGNRNLVFGIIIPPPRL